MPRLQDIEQFKATLRSLGKETETLAQWGEAWQDMPPPPQGVPDDIAALLGAGNQAESPSLGSTLDAPAAGGDFASFLDDLSIGDQTPGGETPVDDFELPAGLEELTEVPATEPVSQDLPEATIDDFSVPGSLLEGFDSMIEASSEDAEESVPDLETVAENPEDDFNIPDALLEGLETPARPEEKEGETEETFGLDDLESLSGSPAESDTAGDFSMPEFTAEESASAPPEAEPEPESTPEAESPAQPGFDLGSESMEGDSFDQFDLGGAQEDRNPAASVPELGAEDFSTGMASGDIDGQLASLDGEAPAADNFSLDTDWGGDFSIPGFEMGVEKSAAPVNKPQITAGAPPAGAFGEEHAKPREEKQARPVDLSDAQADALQDTLLSYPLNLRLAVEDIIANARGTESQQSDLIWMLVARVNARDAAKFAGRILKRYIEIPAGFTKKSGAAFEAEKGSLRYVFVHSILPVLQILILVAAAAGALFYLGYTFAYRPLRANSLYSQGRRQIELDKYGESLEFFDRADKEWTMKGWHYRYAEAYADKGQYPRAEAMYERLLEKWPRETKAALDYAKMEYDNLSFDKTESVLQLHILQRDYFNRSALLLSAQNYLAWADFSEQRYEGPDVALVESLYEKARLQLATLMERHGRSDSYLELMLVYLIRTEHSGGKDKLDEILPLAEYFMGNRKSTWSAATLAELGDYLLGRNETDHVNAILLAAVDRDGSLPEAHAAMARWNRRSGFPQDELKALEFAARFFAEADAKTGLSIKRTKRYMESLIRLGELRRENGRSLDAEDSFNLAIERYERALSGMQIRRDPQYGRAYALLADIYYSERMDFDGALRLYSQAEDNGWVTPETDYRRGYIHYMRPDDDGTAALGFFYRAGLDANASPYLQWATANALYARGDYFAAQGYLSTLADRLQFELDTIALPSPQVKPSHAEIVELLTMTRNNRGAALYRVSERMGDARRRADAMVEFTESARLYDSLSRDQTSMIRSESKNLGFLNLDFVLHPMRGIDLALYRTIPTEMNYPKK